METRLRTRRVARIVLLDIEHRLLLFDTELAYTRAWITPGGGLEGDESWEECALRELREETGITDALLTPCIWTVQFRFAFDGVVYDQHERYFATRVSSGRILTDRWTATEALEIREYRWWSLEEISRSVEAFRPANLSQLLPAIIDGRYPESPIAAAVEHGARTL